MVSGPFGALTEMEACLTAAGIRDRVLVDDQSQ